MTFDEALSQTIDILRRYGRVSYRALKRQFGVDDSFIDDLKAELIEVHELAIDQDGKILVWVVPEEAAVADAPLPPEPPPRTAAAASASRPEATHSEGERRQLSVLFCDLIDSTALSARLDPEDFREVVNAYYQAAGDVIRLFGGHIAQYLGDGLLVYHGYPVAHEDDAVRAVHSALATIAAVDKLNANLAARHQVRLGVRIGIHTGLVVIGEVESGRIPERVALGETLNLAARLQVVAAPNSVVVSAATWRLVQGYFVGEELGAYSLRGVTQPVYLYRIVAESSAQSRLEANGQVTPIIGRGSELQLLLERWNHSKDGHGHTILLSGEAGVGKSRLLAAVREQVMSEGATRITFHCSPFHTNSALYPVVDHIQRLLDFRRDDSPQTRLAKLERGTAGYRFRTDPMVALFAALLSVPVPEGRYPPLPPNSSLQRLQTLDAITAWLLEEAERLPSLVVFEDLHWADPTTLEALQRLLDQIPMSAMLLILAFRPDFELPWSTRSSVTHLVLSRLSRAQTERMILSAAHGRTLPPEVVEQVAAKSDGVPLFIEELVKMIVESGLLREKNGGYVLREPLQTLAIPTTLQDSLMARLDRLNTAREIAQLGATIGREFSHELLQAVADIDERALTQGLRQIVAAEIVYARGQPPQTTYFFKHALIRDAAYESLLRSRRRQYHARIAQAIEEQFAETCETQPDLLAHHYTEAGLAEKAIGYWQRAGQQAVERSANLEAIAHLSNGLGLVDLLPEPLRAQAELDLRVALGVPLIATRGYTAPEVELTYARARELSDTVGGSPQLANILWGLWVRYLTGGPIGAALEMAGQYRAIAEQLQQSGLLLETCQVMGIALFYLGDFARAREYLARGSGMYDPERHHALIYEHGGADTGVAIRTHEALTLWTLGYPDRARQSMQAALATARALASHPFSVAFGHYFNAWFHKLCRDERGAEEAIDVAIGICDEHRFPFWGLASACLRGSTLVECAAAEEGVTAMRQALASYEEIGGQLYRPELLGLLGTGLARTGRIEEALQTVTEALAAVEQSQDCWWRAELYRLRGELIVAASESGAAAIAEEVFQQALAISRDQRAKSWELRAAMSLARLWQGQGKPREARQLLGDVYDWFIEGFDTGDLHEAAALLDELRR